ncbi:hypothetical protein L2X99_10275 [Microbacterium sp. KUDC0406]|uniref:hypothetical protein n=1 Tax=Microbacterium sp. KUDC0406 TaxID=2909588 RepID=UPI001F37155F|nr:hypothetical protein [Microbacterium sp. KUDC0406]UJP08876.1 hypothetical protein L2X99_10275 [Microbacterium sp. KUDC0406]
MTDDQEIGVHPALTRGMKIAIAVVAVVIAAAVITIVLLWSPWDAPDASAPVHPAAGTTSSATPSPGATGGASGSSGDGATAPSPGPSPDATPGTGSEVLPPSATPGTGLPPLKKADPLVSAPLPATGSQNGALVKGFPTRILGPMKGSTVISSSIATEGKRMQVTLIAVAPKAEKDIAAHYGELWAGLGLQRGTTADGTVQYTGSYESVTLAIEPSGTGNRYTLFGTFRAK